MHVLPTGSLEMLFLEKYTFSCNVPTALAVAPRISVAHGLSWKMKAVLDLLALWGKEKVQAALRVSHRNIDYFEAIAKDMQARGHNCMAVECRMRTKTIHLQYRCVVEESSQTRNN